MEVKFSVEPANRGGGGDGGVVDSALDFRSEGRLVRGPVPATVLFP